jgi:eukaryotic-like serine/threonine-protein kinase
MPVVVDRRAVPSLSRYSIEPTAGSRLGEGGMGVVFRAKDLLYDHDVAIKTIQPSFIDEDSDKLFYREATLHARLSVKYRDQIVPVENYGVEDGFPFMHLELQLGGSLRNRIKKARAQIGRNRPLFDEATIKNICRQIATGLSVLHSERVWHMDLKPENVLFTSPDGLDLKIADLGIAQIAESGYLTRAGIKTFQGGTMDYTPVEVATGTKKATASTDIYSLGVILHELLSGVPLAWKDAKREIVRQRAWLSQDAQDLIIRSCQLMGSNNFRSIERFLERLESSTLTKPV